MADADYQRLGSACKSRAQVALFSCSWCSSTFRPKHSRYRTFCSRGCSTTHQKEHKAPRFSAYYAAHCAGCGCAWGAKREWSRCPMCVRQAQLQAGRDASRAIDIARHKAAARVTVCERCEARFCPVYGHSACKLCGPCAEDQRRDWRKAQRVKRRAKKRSASVEIVFPTRVFARDGWLCRLCGIPTPKHKRGSYDHDAPELDHVVPLSRGGAHSYANTQCLCRSCNAYKGARDMQEVEEALLA
jgi:5-methylcytosine-specific restriction endonuclease McrA